MDIDQEVLDDFLVESEEVIKNLKIFISSYKEPTDNYLFEKYGQQIDRIMGTAYTIGLTDLGELAKMGKELGYKGSQVAEPDKLFVVQSLLAQLLKKVEYALKLLRLKEKMDQEEVEDLLKKLHSASAQLGDLRTSVRN